MYPNLKLQLWKAGLRQNRLARLVNIDETILSRIVNGFREPSPEIQKAIADVLHSDPEWLFIKEEPGDGTPLARSAVAQGELQSPLPVVPNPEEPGRDEE